MPVVKSLTALRIYAIFGTSCAFGISGASEEEENEYTIPGVLALA